MLFQLFDILSADGLHLQIGMIHLECKAYDFDVLNSFQNPQIPEQFSIPGAGGIIVKKINGIEHLAAGKM